ncbi:hypothetical protein MVES1_003145 [Malassezia vespertilionis]|uniref:Dynein heavy chain, cytoplasmic n=1 Tax=Malassezia vespertilionis TaxID=2020962 RepID=A0A2N1J919_9BASI|nr:uncharacterized protein MVES1_003145 [Malassezia vespertilionis]PKI83053.1 hypothetical protein MVES_002985 [Malassezia vespertilionis]WFD07774.1 hypothetical protein MVES1_003145 [Malassezia vespertilionis]
MDAAGDWSAAACRTVACELTSSLDLAEYYDSIVDTIVWMHFSVAELGARVGEWDGRCFYRSPQHLLALLHSFRTILGTLRDQLEEQQRFRLVGLDKLRATVEQVEELQATLATKRTRLEQTNADANDRLQRMVHDQQAAETKREASLQLQSSLKEQENAAAARRDSVLTQLAEAEPAVLDAQVAVGNITKQHLAEVRSMANPPASVKSALESVCILLGHEIDGWKSVQAIVRRDDFIHHVVHLDTKTAVPRATRDRLERAYLSRAEYNYETMQHASKACGPLARWVMAQVHFADILDRVAPLRAEVAALESHALDTKAQAQGAAEEVTALESSICAYKREYAALISETQTLTTELERVSRHVERSVHLLAGLGAEKARWEHGRSAFDAQVRTLPGDALLCAAVVAFSGFFDQASREQLWADWNAHMDAAAIPHRANLSVVDMLASADTQAQWHAQGLPTDALATENAAIMEHCARHPLIVDPTGRTSEFLRQRSADQLACTSFLDGGFVKALESALRFGTSLLIENAEHFDPILLPVLRNERRRTGGRVLVRVGSQDVDCAPRFRLLLATRDANAALLPHVFSAVQVVNFTITQKSLQAEALHRILLAEAPEVEARRLDLVRAQGEFQRRLQHLEQDLLTALNTQGNLLENDAIVTTLETLKAEADDIAVRAAQTETAAEDVNAAIGAYEPLAETASAVYFILVRLHVLAPYYQFDLTFFFDLLDTVLRSEATCPNRLAFLHRALLLTAFRRAAPSLLHADHFVYAARLAQVQCGMDVALAALLAPHTMPDAPLVRRIALDRAQRPSVYETFGKHDTPEAEKAPLEEEEEELLAQLLRRAITVRLVCPERAYFAIARVLQAILGADVLEEGAPSLQTILAEISSRTPLAMCSAPGEDPSYQLDQVASQQHIPLVHVALGAKESIGEAERALSDAARTGGWVLLANAHLAPAWLAQLAPRLAALHPAASTRVCVTCELSPALPAAFLRESRVLMYEAPAGLKAALLANLRPLEARLVTGPQEKARLYFLAALLHAILLERLRYVPLGFSRRYEFFGVDFSAALDVVDTWTDAAAQGKAHVAPHDLPFDAIRTMLKESVYGAKLDEPTDRAMLDALVDRLFVPAAFEPSYTLAPGLCPPQGTRLAQFCAWARTLPEPQPCAWLFLAPHAERRVAVERSTGALHKLHTLEHAGTRVQASHAALASRHAVARAETYLAQLPPDALAHTPDQLASFWARERAFAAALLAQVREALGQVVQCDVRTNAARALMEHLVHGTLPDAWVQYAVPRTMHLDAWIADFCARYAQAIAAPAHGAVLGRLFFPTAFLTATRQAAAAALDASLEQLCLHLALDQHVRGPGAFVVGEMFLDGAQVAAQEVVLNEGEASSVVQSTLLWKQEAQAGIPIPVFLNGDRNALLFTASVPSKVDSDLAVLRAVALRIA